MTYQDFPEIPPNAPNERPGLDGTRLLAILNTLIHDRTIDWHKRGQDHWDWTGTPPVEPDPIYGTELQVLYWIEQLHYHNFQIWHYEDPCRSGDPAQIVRCKPRIDQHNQARNNCIEHLDELFVQEQPETPNIPHELYASETLGSLIDRISITRLKLYHTIELDGGTLKHSARISTLVEQYVFLKVQAARLLNDLRAGARFIKVFRQLKMYNSPETNPHYKQGVA